MTTWIPVNHNGTPLVREPLGSEAAALAHAKEYSWQTGNGYMIMTTEEFLSADFITEFQKKWVSA